MVEVHNSIIAKAAKAALAPLGFRRKGQSRIWLADHGYWLTVVEFQPSGWSKGSYLNVSAHWLWIPPFEDATFMLSFDYGNSGGRPFIEFHAEEQFAKDAAQLAKIAAQYAKHLCDELHSMDAVADALMAQEQGFAKEGRGRWYAYHAGVASALAGRIDDSAKMFASVLDSEGPPGTIVYPKSQELAAKLNDPDRLRQEVLLLINQHRAFFNYPILDRLPT